LFALLNYFATPAAVKCLLLIPLGLSTILLLNQCKCLKKLQKLKNTWVDPYLIVTSYHLFNLCNRLLDELVLVKYLQFP